MTLTLEKRLRLKVNRKKSAAEKIAKRKFLGFTILNDGIITVSAESAKRI